MQNLQSVVLCPPTHYDIKYEINPWMDKTIKVDPKLAKLQHDTLKAVYASLNISTDELIPDPLLPDQVFATDVGHIENNVFIKARFKYPERAAESEIAHHYFQSKKYRIIHLPEHVYFEGGDFLKIGKRYFYGWGKRSSLEAVKILQSTLNGQVIPIELPDPYFYHLDTCFSPLSEDIALVHAGAFTPDGLRTLQREFKMLISTGGEDNAHLACNFVRLEKHLIMSEGVSLFLKTMLRHLGFTIHSVPMSEYIKGGGSIHCLSLEVWNSEK